MGNSNRNNRQGFSESELREAFGKAPESKDEFGRTISQEEVLYNSLSEAERRQFMRELIQETGETDSGGGDSFLSGLWTVIKIILAIGGLVLAFAS